jgi:hypothetical protein
MCTKTIEALKTHSRSNQAPQLTRRWPEKTLYVRGSK